MENFSRTCKECQKTFDTIQSCLAHEMVAHVKLTENQSRKRRRPTKLKIVETEEWKLLREKATQQILNCPNGSEYITLAKIYQPASENLFDVYEMIVEDLKKILNPEKSLSDYKIRPFGSAITGITFKDSDIDFYIEPPINKKSKKQFSKVLTLLKNAQEFSEIFAIWNARVPIIKCVHKKTGYPLDINTSSGNGVYNSEFLEKLIKSDQRFQPAILILRIWARYRAINKIGGMNSYCLTLLFFFYLQHLEIVPSFRTIQAWAKPVIFDDINYGLNPQVLGKSNDKASVRDIVEGFFKYYYNFDFEHRIVCLYLGHAITWEFLKHETNFPEYHIQIEMFKRKQSPEDEWASFNLPLRSIVVQDPFCLFQNTSKSVNPALLEKIQKHMEITNEVCEQSRTLSNQRWLARLLFEVDQTYIHVPENVPNELPPQKLKKGKPENSETTKNPKEAKVKRKFNLKLTPLDQELFYIRNHLRQECAGKMFSQTDINKIWSEKVVEYLKLILVDILNLDISLIKFSKSPKSNSQEDVHSDNLNYKAKIFTDLDVWSNRVLVKKTSFGNLLKEQIQITKMAKETNSKGGIKPIKISAILTIIVDSSSNIEVELFDDIGSNSKALFDFFSGSVRSLIKGYLEKNLIKDGRF
ncbi:hypothetical protein ACFFRR_008215 [Megaselia abdita]